MFLSISVFQCSHLTLSQLCNIDYAFPLQGFKGRIKLFGACNRQLNLSFPFSALRISCAFFIYRLDMHFAISTSACVLISIQSFIRNYKTLTLNFFTWDERCWSWENHLSFRLNFYFSLDASKNRAGEASNLIHSFVFSLTRLQHQFIYIVRWLRWSSDMFHFTSDSKSIDYEFMTWEAQKFIFIWRQRWVESFDQKICVIDIRLFKRSYVVTY